MGKCEVLTGSAVEGLMIKFPCKALPDNILSTQMRLTSLSIFRIEDIHALIRKRIVIIF